ncbi:MAG: YicC family protein [Flavobacteriales bacterium]|nr:YicC family protein [Flavobacteriales bacterium]
MTGFGKSISEFLGRQISVNIKSLNSKSIDINLRLPIRYKEKEIELRKIISKELIRGKVECFVNIESKQSNPSNELNHSIIKSYIDDLRSISSDLSQTEAMKIAVSLPEVISAKEDEVEQEEWKNLEKTLLEAIEKLNDFRKTEGDTLETELKRNIVQIEQSLEKIIPFEQERVDRVKEKFESYLSDLPVDIDENRLHQELIFYVEKFDITEEKVRLKQHLKYFLETMQSTNSEGKKLGFIAQEIGREINTIGSKANHHEIQKIVVIMKDELEKMKEQLFNVL